MQQIPFKQAFSIWNNYATEGEIARKIGTSDQEYELRSKYVMLTMVDDHPTDAIPAGFKGFLTKLLTCFTLYI